MCELPPKAADMTLETFVASTRELQIALKFARRLIAGDMLWLTLNGPSGVGKTHLAVAICNEWLKAKRPARYVYTPILLDELRAGLDDHSAAYRFKIYCSIPLLVLDDFGLEHSTSWTRERLTVLLNERLMHKLPLVVTSNKHPDEMPGDDEKRIATRLTREDWCEVVDL